MVDLGPAKESIHRHMGYIILLGGITVVQEAGEVAQQAALGQVICSDLSMN